MRISISRLRTKWPWQFTSEEVVMTSSALLSNFYKKLLRHAVGRALPAGFENENDVIFKLNVDFFSNYDVIISFITSEPFKVVILERLLATLGDLSFKIEIESDLIEKVKKMMSHNNEKIKLAAVKCLADLAASPNLKDSWSNLMEIIFTIGHVEIGPIKKLHALAPFIKRIELK